MLLTRTNTAQLGSTPWTASVDCNADAEQVLRALTEPDLIANWAPVSFSVEGLAGGRLRAGSRERVRGTLAGITATFDIEVSRADRERLELLAEGPVGLDVSYRFCPRARWVRVEASVAVRRGRGLTGQLLAPALSAILNAGALDRALARIQRSLTVDEQCLALAA